jgi:arylsulfatase A-like enzyme
VPQANEIYEMSKTAHLGENGNAISYNYFGFQEIDIVNGYGDRCQGNLYTAWLREQVPDAERRVGTTSKYDSGTKDTKIYKLPHEVHSSNYIGDKTAEYIENSGDEPFFLHVSFPDPHPPYCVPEPYASMYDDANLPDPIPSVTESQDMPPMFEHVYYGVNPSRKSRMPGTYGNPTGTDPADYSKYSLQDWRKVRSIYYGMVTLIDENIGKIFASLKKKGLESETIVVFLSDHGDYLGDHGMCGNMTA